MIELTGSDVSALLTAAKKSSAPLVITSSADSTEVRAYNDMESILVTLPGTRSGGVDETLRISPSMFAGVASTKTGVTISDTEISNGRSKVSLRKMEPDPRETLFSTFNADAFPVGVTLSTDDVHAISNGLAAANRGSKMASSSCFLFLEDGTVRFVSTDFYRIYLRDVGVARGDFVPGPHMVTNAAVATMKMLAGKGGATISFGGNLVGMKMGNVEVVTPSSSEAAKNYSLFTMLPSEGDVVAHVDMEDVVAFTKTSSLLRLATTTEFVIREEEIDASTVSESGDKTEMTIPADDLTEGLGDKDAVIVDVAPTLIASVGGAVNGVVTMWVTRSTLGFRDEDGNVFHIVKKRM